MEISTCQSSPRNVSLIWKVGAEKHVLKGNILQFSLMSLTARDGNVICLMWT